MPTLRVYHEPEIKMNLLCATGVYRNKLNDISRRYLSWGLCTVRHACRYKWLSGRLPKVCLGWVGCLLACLLLPYISQNARKYPSLAAQKAGPRCLTGRELGWFRVQLRRRKQKVDELKWASEILFLQSKAKTNETFFRVGVVAHTFNPNGQEVKTNRFKMSSRPSYITEGKKLAEGWRELTNVSWSSGLLRSLCSTQWAMLSKISALPVCISHPTIFVKTRSAGNTVTHL